MPLPCCSYPGGQWSGLPRVNRQWVSEYERPLSIHSGRRMSKLLLKIIHWVTRKCCMPHTKKAHTYLLPQRHERPPTPGLKSRSLVPTLSACSGGGGLRGPLAIAEIKMSSFLMSPVKNMVQPLTKHSWRGLSACSYRPQKAPAALQTSSLLAHMCLAPLTRIPSHNVLPSHWSTCPWKALLYINISIQNWASLWMGMEWCILVTL